MKVKRIAALATLGALLSTVAPAFAASPTITVKWNTQAISSLTITTQASASQTHAASENIYWAGNGSTTSGCAGTTDTASAGTDTSANGTVNFGNVTPDSADSTNCYEVNAAAAYVTTNDTNGWTLGVYASAGVPANMNTANGTELCIYKDGTWANNLAYTASAAAAAVANTSETACASSGIQVPTALSSTNLLSTAASTTGTTLNSDMELVLGPNAATGAQSVTLTYTLATL